MPSSSRPPQASASTEEIARLRAAEELLLDELAELHDSQALLEQSRDDYAELYDLAAVAQLTLTGRGVIRTANWTAAELFEVERNALVGRALRHFIHTMDRAQIGKLASYSQQAVAEPMEVRLTLTSGVFVPVQIWARASSKNGVVHLALVDLRSREREAWQREELVASERSARLASSSKDRFIAMLSHELRTPLMPILAIASRWEQDELLGEEVRRAFRMIRRNAVAESRLVDDLLDATGILRGKMNVVKKPIDVHPVLVECLEAIRPAADEKTVRLAYEPDAEQAIVLADALRLRQVFANLLKNALKATPAGGKITIHSWGSLNKVAVEVLDTGIGFEIGDAARIFDPFDQLDRAAEVRGGLGLGLAISKGLVELHGGSLAALSPGPGKGARFVVELPLTAERERASSPRAGTVEPTGSTQMRRHQLLLVEDHEDTAEAMKVLLEEEGFAVACASCIAQAVAMDRSGIDLIISDLSLPDGTGFDLLRQLDGTARPPAIALSGHGMHSDIEASQKAGFDLHLVKPVDIAVLVKAINDRLTHRSEVTSMAK